MSRADSERWVLPGVAEETGVGDRFRIVVAVDVLTRCVLSVRVLEIDDPELADTERDGWKVPPMAPAPIAIDNGAIVPATEFSALVRRLGITVLSNSLAQPASPPTRGRLRRGSVRPEGDAPVRSIAPEEATDDRIDRAILATGDVVTVDKTPWVIEEVGFPKCKVRHGDLVALMPVAELQRAKCEQAGPSEHDEPVLRIDFDAASRLTPGDLEAARHLAEKVAAERRKSDAREGCGAVTPILPWKRPKRSGIHDLVLHRTATPTPNNVDSGAATPAPGAFALLRSCGVTVSLGAQARPPGRPTPEADPLLAAFVRNATRR